MRHAGVHWPENAGGEHPNVETILGMPGIYHGCTLICSPSARYWYTVARSASPLVVWRAIPRVGKLPAQLGWREKQVADECLNLWDEQPHGGTEWFLPLNELQFSKELGGPFPGYGSVALHLRNLRVELRRRLPGVGLMFPAWVPTDDIAQASQWVDEAREWDAVCLHAYGDANSMRARYAEYRMLVGPDVPIFVGEWNANHTGADEREALEMWAEISDADPAFMGATYYIWETRNAGEEDLSIWGNADRLALFRDPPILSQPAPEPIPEPEPVTMISGIDVSNNNGAIDWDAVVAAGVEWAYAKVSEGANYTDRFFPGNWAAMKARGIVRGGYHFARPSDNEPQAEADHFLRLVNGAGGLEPGDFLVLDHEDERASGDTGGWALEWLHYVEQRVGFKPMLYTGRWIIDSQHLDAYPALADYGLILAAYQSSAPPAPYPWSFLAGWQNDDHTGVPGVTGDHDWFFGTADQLRKYGKPGAAPIPEPSPFEYAVGQGLLDAMEAQGDEPACDEIYVKAGSRDAYSEAFGTSGSRYVYVASLGRVYRFDPAA